MADRHPLIIAHRGASGYLPEHTLEAKALAFGMGADYIEQDVVATRDDQLIVLHDLHLDSTTNVAEVFPDRHRDDGHFYARDFDLVEIRTLNAHEARRSDGRTARFRGRFPTDRGAFRVPTLAEEIELVQGLNRSTGRNVGIYPEIKHPAWHREEGVDLSRLVLDALHEYDYTTADHKVFVQCFDPGEMRRIRDDFESRLRLVQLTSSAGDTSYHPEHETINTPEGLKVLAETTDGYGPSGAFLYATAEIDGHPVSTGLVTAAHDAGLVVHPYTFRADMIPGSFESYAEMVRWFVTELRIDGLFTDFPDLTRAALAG